MKKHFAVVVLDNLCEGVLKPDVYDPIGNRTIIDRSFFRLAHQRRFRYHLALHPVPAYV
jgi:hypothetical protein